MCQFHVINCESQYQRIHCLSITYNTACLTANLPVCPPTTRVNPVHNFWHISDTIDSLRTYLKSEWGEAIFGVDADDAVGKSLHRKNASAGGGAAGSAGTPQRQRQSLRRWRARTNSFRSETWRVETAEVRREDRKDCMSRDDEIHRWVEGKD